MTTPRPPKEPQDEEQRWKWVESADSQRAHAALAGVLILGALPWAQQFSTTSIFYFASLAVCTIYIGAHKSLSGGPRQQLSMKEVRCHRASAALDVVRSIARGMRAVARTIRSAQSVMASADNISDMQWFM